MTDWSDVELEAAVVAYRRMQQLESQHEPIPKSAIYRDLAAAHHSRSAKAFEYRMQNISAVLMEEGLPWLPGLKPAGNVGSNVRPRLLGLLKNFPVYDTKEFTSAAYLDKLPALREWLVRIAKAGNFVSFGQVMEAFDMDRISLQLALNFLGHQAIDLGEPNIAALVISADTGHCSVELLVEFGITDDEAERKRLYAYWQSTSSAIDASAADTFEARKAKFVSTEVRPDQAAFRRRLFEHYKGKCAICGFDIVQILDAAHKKGRDWRRGQNQADDGYLLRKDFHALYDADLLWIAEDGLVTFHESVQLQYAQFQGISISVLP